MRIFDKTCFIIDMDATEEEIRDSWVEVLDGVEVKDEKVWMEDALGRKTYELNGYLIEEEWTRVI